MRATRIALERIISVYAKKRIFRSKKRLNIYHVPDEIEQETEEEQGVQHEENDTDPDQVLSVLSILQDDTGNDGSDGSEEEHQDHNNDLLIASVRYVKESHFSRKSEWKHDSDEPSNMKTKSGTNLSGLIHPRSRNHPSDQVNN